LSSPPAVITIDVSFISLKHVLPAATVLAAPSARRVA
jgi:predicted rRNA methylase YqxC with S4 and FtsJ domains